MASGTLMKLVCDMAPGEAQHYRIVELASPYGGPVMLTIHGRPVLIASNFADNLDQPDQDKQVSLRFHRAVKDGQNSGGGWQRVPSEFVVTIPPNPAGSVQAQAEAPSEAQDQGTFYRDAVGQLRCRHCDGPLGDPGEPDPDGRA